MRLESRLASGFSPKDARGVRKVSSQDRSAVGYLPISNGQLIPAVIARPRVFGTDRIRFSNCSMTLPAGQTCTDAKPKLRSFRSFSEAANENGLSRILVGIHLRRAVEEGIEHGRNIGRRAVERFMRPLEDRGTSGARRAGHRRAP